MHQPTRVETQLFAVGKIISFLGCSWRLTEDLWNDEEAGRTGPGLRTNLPEVLDELRRYLPSLEARYTDAGGSSVYAAGLESLAERCSDLAREIVGSFPAQEAVVAGGLDASMRVHIGQIARDLGDWLLSVVR